ncbi:unnamed protein product [Echinostoma caproni]|uniref:BHLH domain-containing protein n=1 Tax=Echinostoma caproni TaxID=27848 RepID=A0A183A7B6_9TREM|nr:unnamed protein product [Echinostoma caproni]
MTHEIPRIPSSMPEKPQEAPTVPVPAVRKSRRGRRSTVPPEQREHVRRLKKQNMERRRRACIADKMNALHSLAMNLIGEDPAQYQKAEKADLLNMCYNVFEHLVTIVNDEPVTSATDQAGLMGLYMPRFYELVAPAIIGLCIRGRIARSFTDMYCL